VSEQVSECVSERNVRKIHDFSPQDTQHTLPENCTLALLELLPSVKCLSPRQALQQMKTGKEGKAVGTMADMPTLTVSLLRP